VTFCDLDRPASRSASSSTGKSNSLTYNTSIIEKGFS
jgi:hypothetical protein